MENIVEIIEVEQSSADIPDTLPTTGASIIYRITPEAKARTRELILNKTMWQCLVLVNGKRNIEKIAQEANLSLDTTRECLSRLELMNLVCELDAISLQTFIATRNQTGDRSTPDNGAMHTEQVSAGGLAEIDTAADCTKPTRRSLNCLLKLVRSRCSKKRYSELTVYRIFTGVPRELFLRAGIDSFLFIDDRTQVQDPDLFKALVSETKRVLGVDVCAELAQCSHA